MIDSWGEAGVVVTVVCGGTGAFVAQPAIIMQADVMSRRTSITANCFMGVKGIQSHIKFSLNSIF
jgi:hypothetical protein